MSDDLVKRLRDWEHVWLEDEGEPEGSLYLEAADRIEDLTRRHMHALRKIDVLEDQLGRILQKIETELKGQDDA